MKVRWFLQSKGTAHAPMESIYVEVMVPSCSVCALGHLKMMKKKKNIAKFINFNLADSRIYHLRGCLATLNIPADRLALREYSKTHEKPYKFIVCEFGSSLEAFRVWHLRMHPRHPYIESLLTLR